MNIPRAINRRQTLGAPMTPMIDVVFLLLIFFVCTASFGIPEMILSSRLNSAGATPIELPTEPTVERKQIVIRVPAGSAAVMVGGNRCESQPQLATLLTRLAAVDLERLIILDVDRTAKLGRAIDVYDECRLAGFERVQFVVRKVIVD